jgi:uncharacterized membrane protein
MRRCTTNPIDVLEVMVMLDEIAEDLRQLRIGVKSLRRTWGTSSVGLSRAVRAASSLAVRTAECSALLSYMAASAGDLTLGQEQTLLSASETSWKN